MLAQAQEVFLEKQIADGKKVGLLAKLASQAAFLYTQATEGAQENVQNAIFEKVWLLVCQVCAFKGLDLTPKLTETDQSTLHDFVSAVLPGPCRR